ncbi:NAD-dependent epimerase/dehydratase family protein [Tessaracoccus defluvii]|uniref:NAD-dependent epimerase/dehydratase family protein n=1 Tax=Tessaracoccus defluvii TaxID=1285901 RepID=A0A7H0H4S4_9ACTN|nr:NAD-dependent epimerase/dehydratase family protein [Tessaracoccus defluvii]QNP55540.1 NAD-dependent epimerase/dehydratase family protein [Tessaracoccus defluvii]
MTHESPQVLVTGASGFLGGHVVTELTSAGYRVLANGRDAGRLAGLGVDTLAAPLAALPTAPLQGVDAIVHCAALSSPWGRWADFREANVDGTAAVIEAARRNGVRRIVFVSSPSVYSQAADRLDISEDDVDPGNRLNHYIASKLRAEELVRAAVADGSVPEAVILRPRGLIGAGDPSLAPRLLDVHRRIGVPLFREGTNLVDLTAVENVALAARLALEHANAHGQAYNITNGDPRPFRELLDRLLTLVGETPRYRRVSIRVLYPLAAVLEKLYAVLPGYPEPPLTRYTLTTIAYSQTLDISRARADLGYVPRVSLDDALAAFAATRATRRGH